MKGIELLRALFDDKIIKVINVVLEHPDKQFSLTQLSSASRVNITTVSRIVDKLVKNEFVELILIGKSKFYKLMRNEKTLELAKLLRKEEHLSEFTNEMKLLPPVEKVVLENKSTNGAKLIIVGDLLPTEKLNALVDRIKKKYDFRIQFIDISKKQFVDMKNMGLYDLEGKIIYDREKKK